MKAGASLTALLAAACAVSAPAAASAACRGGGWAVRGFAAYVEPLATDLEVGADLESQSLQHSLALASGSGFGLSVEYRPTCRIGVEAIGAATRIEMRQRLSFEPFFTGSSRDDIGAEIAGLGVNLHLTPRRVADLYAGVLVGRVEYGDFEDPGGNPVFRADLTASGAIGATVGVDLPLGTAGRWALSTALRQLWSGADRDLGELAIEVDPLLVGLGLAYRWGGDERR